VADLTDYARLVTRDHGLSVVSTLRADQTIQASVVNTGVLDHPLHGRPRLTVTVRAGWEWVAVEGTAELIGPDDPAEGVDAEGLRLLLRDVFSAAGGTHDDWATYDRVMAEERRAAVLITPARVY
jgi:hypothetical protein